MTTMPDASMDEQAPDWRFCDHCGAELEPVELPTFHSRANGKVARSFVLYRACECEGAKAEREREEAEEAARKAAAKQRAREATLKRAGIPKRYWNAQLDDEGGEMWLVTEKGERKEAVTGEELLAMVRDGRGLFLTGKSGRGKTHTGCAILLRLMAEHVRVKFADVEKIEREVKAAWDERGQTEEGVIARYVNAPVVVIDDLGAEELTPTTMKTLRAVISGREAEDAVTIFTSNYSRRDFALHIAQESDRTMASRLASRIAGMTEVVEFTGEDRRLTRD